VVNKLQRKRARREAPFDIRAHEVLPPVSGGVVVQRNTVPRITTTSTRTVVHNTEAFTNTTGSVVFNSGRFNIVPSALTWLNVIGSAYSKYRWLRVRLIWIPSTGTTNTGQVVGALGYDSNDTGPANIIAAQQVYKAITTPPWAGYGGSYLLNDESFPKVSPESVAIDVDTTRFIQPWYPFATAAALAAANGVERNVLNPVYLDVSTSGNVAAVVVGTWFAKYSIELIEPQIPTQNV
jgi:hypothetical protein